MLTPLWLFSAAHALCVLRQEGTNDGAIVYAEARTGSLPCRELTLESATPGMTAKAWILRRAGGRVKLTKDHVVAFDGGLSIGAPELEDGDTLRVQAVIPGQDLLVTVGPRQVLSVPEQTHVTRRVLLDEKHPGWGFADPKLASTVTETHTIRPDGSRTWTEAGARAQDVIRLAPGSFTLLAPGIDIDTTVSAGVTETRESGGWRFDAPRGGELRYVVRAAGLDLVIPDQRTFIAGTDSYFAVASFPEPAVPVAMRGIRDNGELLNVLYGEIMERRDGALPGANPLRPRPLMKAWRSTWATPVERALILHRMLGQERIQAEWSLTGAAADVLTLTGFDTMLIRAKLGDTWTWLDPSCATCQVGEIAPRWMGQPAIGADHTIPRQPGTLRRSLQLNGERFHARFVATGAAALWLREVNATAEVEKRNAALAAALGMAGAEVTAFEGLDSYGADVSIELDGGDPPRDPFPSGTPWDGGWQDG